jgi:arylsulfatase A-like enzyme
MKRLLKLTALLSALGTALPVHSASYATPDTWGGDLATRPRQASERRHDVHTQTLTPVPPARRGGPETYPHMAAGWAVMFDTPYQWTKQVGSDFGGTKVGMAIHWPKGIKAKGE